MNKNSPRHKSRLAMLATIPSGGVVAEIGVWRGDFSECILEETKPTKLYLIDPWLLDIKDGIVDRRFYIPRDRTVRIQKDLDRIYMSVLSRFSDDERVVIIRAKSIEAAKGPQIPQLDWVYIDGCHHFKSAIEDLQIWGRKVKPGGLIIADDYYWPGPGQQYPVQKAVRAFLRQNGESLSLKAHIGEQVVIEKGNP
jgi:SAM-dependent methyltransferase